MEISHPFPALEVASEVAREGRGVLAARVRDAVVAVDEAEVEELGQEAPRRRPERVARPGVVVGERHVAVPEALRGGVGGGEPVREGEVVEVEEVEARGRVEEVDEEVAWAGKG